MVQAALLGWCAACLLAGCQSGYEQHGHLDAASQAFVQRMHYPYIASKARRRQIERASRVVDVGMSKARALALLGPPDIKVFFDGSPISEAWTYIHTWRYRDKPDYHGRILVLSFDANAPDIIDNIELLADYENNL